MELTIIANTLLIVLILLIFNAMFILGLHGAAQEPYVLSKPHDIWNKILLGWDSRFFIINYLKDALYESSIGCTRCMASFHSITFLQTIAFYSDVTIITPSLIGFILWAIYVCILSYLVDFFDKTGELIKTFIVKNS